MLSALSVLALVLAADGTPASKESPVEVIALAVDVDFVCRTRTTQSLILTPKAQGQLEVPKDCPDAGADWRLTLDCSSKERCTGYVRTPKGAIAFVEGNRKQPVLKPMADEHPPTLDFMGLRITGQHTLQLKTAEEHQRPVQLLLQLPTVTGAYTLAPVELSSVDFEHQGKRLSLRVQVSWTDDEHVHLRLWSARKEPLLDETLELQETRELDCHRLNDICAGKMTVLVREVQRIF
ncbi:hypothetical protein [Vitiosangium sp. GDMCC 1.1324]|uniref:hypothetical protein n=1 Tax=Vitiosangium sp. (strain GDMCC 1.1324) TaxID=2138576 RepID=UPI000D399579|nr:hypothetical protein [Vitiosangium sp. GDMCC 1.1324]PTL77849.1 hypothetical protein DAT35_42375 [Vitiosangium sp. GDMCC 1.1324]